MLADQQYVRGNHGMTELEKTGQSEFLALDVQKASASFPEGWDSSFGRFSSQEEVSNFLKGKRIAAVEFTGHCTIKFVLEGGVAVSLTPAGTEGDDLELTFEKPA